MTTSDVLFELTPEHIKTTCKPGADKNTCRYLAMGSTGFTCEKFGPLMETIDSRIINKQMKAQGDNCNALLEKILEAKDKFIGKRVHYIERMPTIEIEGVVRDLTLDEKRKLFSIYIDAGEDSFPHQFTIANLEITNTGTYFEFGVSGVGALAGTTKIYK